MIVAAIVLAQPARVRADEFRAVVDRVDLEPSSLGGNRLRIYLSALTVQGQLLDLTDPKSIKLIVGTSEKKVPFALGHYNALGANTAIVFIVQVTQDFQPSLGTLSDALDAVVLAPMNEHTTQAAVLTFGDSVGAGKLAATKTAHTKLTGVQSDGTTGDPALLDTIERALLLLRKAQTEPEGRPIRKLIVVVGDGRDRSGDRDRVTRVGKRAAKEGVRIHTLGFSPNDVRRPLFLLGELSKQSLGTFRWVRGKGADSWTAPAEQLRDEIAKQYVLTYFLPADDEVANKKLKIVAVGRTEVTSNEVRIPSEATCGGQACEAGMYCASDRCIAVAAATGRGIFGWLLLVGGIAVGGVVVLGFIGYMIQRSKEPPLPFPFPGQPGANPGAAGLVPGGPGVVPGAPGAPNVAGMPILAPPPGKQPKPPKKKREKKASMPPPVVAPTAASVPAVAAPVAARGPWLFIMTGPRAGERLALRHGFWIGKASGCDFVIDDGYASSQHAQLGQDTSGAYWLYDRGSTNGTFVNGTRVLEQSLAHNAVIQIGSMQLRFQTE